MNKSQETETTEERKAHFEKLTGTSVSVKIIPEEKNEPTHTKSNHCGVYSFVVGTSFFKVGKVGPKRKARWTTHHYKQDKARSTLAKSILAHNGILKSQYPQKKHIEIDGISNENIANCIKNNIFRI